MNEKENAKETAGELPRETQKTPETPKEPKIKKIYNIFGLIQNILFVIIITWGLSTIGGILTSAINSCNIHSNVVASIFNYLILFSLLPSALSIIIAIELYVLYLCNRTDKNKKTYGQKFIIKGILGAILTYIIYFVVTVIVVFKIDPMNCVPPLIIY